MSESADPIYIEAGHPQYQPWLLPPSIDQFVTQDAPARILSMILDELDLKFLHDNYKGGGRRPYDPVALIRIITFGLMNGVRSSRKLAEAAAFDLRYKFLAKMAQPDFRTIARFRAKNESNIKSLFNETIRLGTVAGLIDLKHVSIDGTKIQANASKRKYRSDEELDELINKADEVAQSLLEDWKQNDIKEDIDDNSRQLSKKVRNAQKRKKHLEDAKQTLEGRKSKGIVITDQDSRMMKHKSGLHPGYNAQAVVDSNCQMIIAAEITQDEGDNLQFKPMVEVACKNMGKVPEKLSADGGYWSTDALFYADEKKLDAYIAPSGTQPDALEDWIHDESADTYTAPNGDLYTFEKQRGKKKNKINTTYRIYWCKATDVRKWIPVRKDGVPGYTEMQMKTSTTEGAAVYRWRKAIIEPVFAHIKVGYGFRRMLLRGLSGAKTEYLLACIAHNLSKIINYRKPVQIPT